MAVICSQYIEDTAGLGVIVAAKKLMVYVTYSPALQFVILGLDVHAFHDYWGLSGFLSVYFGDFYHYPTIIFSNTVSP